MATSSASIPASAAAGGRSLTESDSEEIDYEEMIIEEEIEVEEDVIGDDHEEEEDDEDGEDLSPLIGDGDDEKREIIILSDDEKSSECDGGIMNAETTNPMNGCSKQVTASDKAPHSEEQTTQMSNVSDAQQMESRSTHVSMKACRHVQSVVLAGKTTIISNDEKSSQCDGGIMTSETTTPLNKCSKQVTASDKVPHSEEQTIQVITKGACDAQQKESRLDDDDVTLIRPRRLSPAMNINKGNKCPASMCSFFAKGLCIKGSSCRFHHIKDATIVGDIQNKTQKSDEGVSKATGSDLAISARTTITYSSEIKPTSQKEIPATNFLFNDVDKDNPFVKADGSLHGALSKPFMGFPSTHGSSWVSPYATKMEEFGGKGYDFGLHNHDYNTSYHSLVWPGTSTFSSSSSWKSDPKSSSFDWEPSKPFRAQFLTYLGISTPDIQFRSSIKPPPKIGDKLSKLSSSSLVQSISGTHSSLKEKLKTEYGSDRFSIGSHVNGKNGMGVDSNEVADTKQETIKTASKGKMHTGDVVQAGEVHVSSHSSLRQNDGGPTKEVSNSKLDFDSEGDTHRESKPIRHFRVALTKSVRELLKPKWRDGKLSKDAHKLIVKKVVDKVLTTLPPEKIPNVKGYLTSSQKKLMKLVEGYIAKYGKI